MNSVLLIGRLATEVEVEKIKDHNVARVLIEIQREFKNKDGNWSYDKIPVTLWEGYAETAKSMYKKGDYLLIRGRVNAYNFTDITGRTFYNIEIYGEKVKLLPNNNREEITEM